MYQEIKNSITSDETVNYDVVTDEEAYKQALINNKYNHYSKNRVNFSDSANKIMEKIKDGYEPTEAEIFELMCDEQDKIDKYRTMYDIKQRINDNGKILIDDFNYIVDEINPGEEMKHLLEMEFASRGLIEYSEDEKENTYS